MQNDSAIQIVRYAQVQMNIKVPAKRYWEALKEAGKLFPQIAPQLVASVENIEGVEGKPGSVRLIKFGEVAPEGSYVKEKLVSVDESSYTVASEEIEGGHLGVGYTKFAPTIKLLPGSDDDTDIRWTVRYEADCDVHVSIDESEEAWIKLFRALEQYLLAN